MKIEKPVMVTERLVLRNWKDSDTVPFIDMNSDPEVMNFFPNPLSEKQSLNALQSIQQGIEKNGFGLYAVEEIQTGNFMGFTGFSIPAFTAFFTPCIEIGWRLRKEYWNKGYATEAAKSCLNFGFNNFSFSKLVSFTSLINHPSERVMIKLGMEKIGEFDHPKLPLASPLSRHLLYQIENK